MSITSRSAGTSGSSSGGLLRELVSEQAVVLVQARCQARPARRAGGRPSRGRPPARSMSGVTLGSGGAGTSQAGPDRAARLGECLERARNGEMGALSEVVRELNPLLWHVARAEGLTAEESADVVQTTWLELLRRLHDIRSPRAPTSWLVTATRREAWRAREVSRRQAPDGAAQLEAVSDPDLGPVERLLSGEQDQVLWRHFQ